MPKRTFDKSNIKGVFAVKLDLRPLLAGDRLLTFDYELPLEVDPEDTSSFLYGSVFPSPMKVQGEITNTAGYMRMQLHASVDYVTPCARCLTPVSGAFILDLEKTVAPRSLLGDLTDDKLDDFAILEDGFLDMDEQIRQQAEMEFPARVLCREDCKGLCPQCGCDLNTQSCTCKTHDIDPRLLPLQKLLDEMKQEEK